MLQTAGPWEDRTSLTRAEPLVPACSVTRCLQGTVRRVHHCDRFLPGCLEHTGTPVQRTNGKRPSSDRRRHMLRTHTQSSQQMQGLSLCQLHAEGKQPKCGVSTNVRESIVPEKKQLHVPMKTSCL